MERWIENWKKKGFEVSSMKPSCAAFITGSISGFNCIKDMDDWRIHPQQLCRRSRTGGVVDTQSDHVAIQSVFGKQEKWPERNIAKFIVGKSISYTWGGITLCTNTEWGLKNSLAEKAMSVLVDKLKMIEQHALTKKANRSKELNPPVCSALERLIWSARASSGLPSAGRTQT